eukprot:253415_1
MYSPAPNGSPRRQHPSFYSPTGPRGHNQSPYGPTLFDLNGGNVGAGGFPHNGPNDDFKEQLLGNNAQHGTGGLLNRNGTVPGAHMAPFAPGGPGGKNPFAAFQGGPGSGLVSLPPGPFHDATGMGPPGGFLGGLHSGMFGPNSTTSRMQYGHQYPPPRPSQRGMRGPQKGTLRGPVKADITKLDIRYDPPVAGCELQPFVMLQNEKGQSMFLEDLGELQYRWYRGQKRLCSQTPCSKGAKIQCITCLKLKIPVYLSYFCCNDHFQQGWSLHRQMHNEKSKLADESVKPHWGDFESADESTFTWQFALNKSAHERGAKTADPNSMESLSCRFPPMISNIWAEVSQNKTYTPTIDDVGRQLLLECAPVMSAGSVPEHNAWVRKDTSSVMPKPDPAPPRAFMENRNVSRTMVRNGFKTMSYNILADIYATQQMYPYCPMWVLSWNYRRGIILREIFRYDCDIVCLQEVQQNHFDDFFVPELAKKGYEGLYKRKTRDAVGDDPKCIDGCCIFYKKERFAVMEQYAIEFNEAAKGSFENMPGDWRSKLRRLSKGNVALVCVLEELRSEGNLGRNRRKRRLCVANTHIFWDPAYADVKLWQTWILLQELQKMVLGRDLPLVICGDFNSTSDSAVYEMLSTERLRDDHPVLTQDKLGIFVHGELTHNLPLVSAYGTVFGEEPKYTNYTMHFADCLDYIFYSKNHLTVIGVVDIDAEELVKEHGALPSERYASDHIAMIAEFAFL